MLTRIVYIPSHAALVQKGETNRQLKAKQVEHRKSVVLVESEKSEMSDHI